MSAADVMLNLMIVLVTLVLVAGVFRKDGKWAPERGKKAFRYYTCLSNVLCAVTALVTAGARLAGEIPEWVWILKYIGTAAVTVTMLTVFLFLAPSQGKDWYSVLLKGPANLFMHLLTPLLPVACYGPVYLYQILYAPEEKRWEDFYGFNKGGKWPAAFSAMVIGTFLICMGLMALQNL